MQPGTWQMQLGRCSLADATCQAQLADAAWQHGICSVADAVCTAWCRSRAKTACTRCHIIAQSYHHH
eukprot:10622494-Alexandrium_andersonii.AAC.1